MIQNGQVEDVRRAALELFTKRILARSPLNDAERQAIMDLPGQVATIKPNEDFVGLGEVVDRTCLVADGLLGRFGQTRDGSRQISAFYIAGDMPDLYSFVMPRSAWALVGLTRTTVVRIPHVAVAEITTKFPNLATVFWRDCMVDAATTAEWILNIGRRDAKARVAHILCEMAKRHEQIGRFANLSFPLPLTQEHLADATGLTSVHVNRTLKKLKVEGAAHLFRQVVQVLDWSRLMTIADFDAGYLHLD